VKVSSRRGELYVQVAADPDLRRGVAFLPMHWGQRFLGGRERQGVNELTLPALDPFSRQPELKHCAVRVEQADLPWGLVAFGPADFEALAPLMQAAPFACRTLLRRGVRLQLGFRESPGEDLVRAVDRVFGLQDAALRFDDARRAVGRRIALDGDTIGAVRLSGELRSEPWLREQFERGADVGELRRYLLLPVDAPPGAPAPRGRTVCNCFDVSEQDISAFSDLPSLQQALKCGTSCGSCLPELRRLVAA
jgi:assimilatory nitrate reductase catalytic subunit